MRNRLLLTVLAVGLAFASFPSHAVTYNDGDSCSEAGASHQKKDAQGVYFLVCNGSTWKAVYTAAIDEDVGIGTTNPSSGLKLDVEGNIGAMQFCDETGGNCFAASAVGGSGSSLWSPSSGTDSIYYNSGTPQVGIGNDNPQATLDVSGEIIIGSTNATCDTNRKGGLRWNDTDSNIEMCDGTEWKEIISTSVAASADPTPDAFSFTDVTDQSLSALILSNTLTITGFDGPVIAEVSGSGTPQISINGGSWVTAGEINPGETLRVRLISSGSVSTARVAAVTVGDTTDNWSVTTKAGQTRIFVTGGLYNGAAIGGLSGADSICASAAASNGYSGTWKALLSDSTTNAVDRLTIVYPVVRASDSAVIDASNIWDGALAAVPGTSFAWTWTGTIYDGTKDANTCSDWTSTATNGTRGNPGSNNDSWLQYAGADACTHGYRLYCVEQ